MRILYEQTDGIGVVVRVINFSRLTAGFVLNVCWMIGIWVLHAGRRSCVRFNLIQILVDSINGRDRRHHNVQLQFLLVFFLTFEFGGGSRSEYASSHSTLFTAKVMSYRLKKKRNLLWVGLWHDYNLLEPIWIYARLEWVKSEHIHKNMLILLNFKIKFKHEIDCGKIRIQPFYVIWNMYETIVERRSALHSIFRFHK